MTPRPDAARLAAAVHAARPSWRLPPAPRGDTLHLRIREVHLLELRAHPDGSVSVRLRGWERDLTDLVGEPRSVPETMLGELLDRVDAAIDRLDAAAAAERDPAPRPSPTARSSGPGVLGRAQALARRTARESGAVADPPLLGADGLTALVEEVWAPARASRLPPEYLGAPEGVTVRPGDASRVEFGWDRHGALWGSVVSEGASLPFDRGTPVAARSDEPSARVLIDRIDRWLRTTRPPHEVTARPIEEDPWR